MLITEEKVIFGGDSAKESYELYKDALQCGVPERGAFVFYPALYSYCKYTNEASIRTAESIGMQFDREYPDEANGMTHVSVIYRRT